MRRIHGSLKGIPAASVGGSGGSFRAEARISERDFRRRRLVRVADYFG